MRRRPFRPALESLDLRITPSDVTGAGAGAPASSGQWVGSYTTVTYGTASDTSDEDQLWLDSSQDPNYPLPPDTGELWL